MITNHNSTRLSISDKASFHYSYYAIGVSHHAWFYVVLGAEPQASCMLTKNITFIIIFTIFLFQARGTAQHLRVLAFRPKDMGSVPSTHIPAHNHLQVQFPERMMPNSGL